mgnify:CR=1 FL=1
MGRWLFVNSFEQRLLAFNDDLRLAPARDGGLLLASVILDGAWWVADSRGCDRISEYN